jgi:poly-gamma-glutamate synthesis protein (capsule biosynthesis protein)
MSTMDVIPRSVPAIGGDVASSKEGGFHLAQSGDRTAIAAWINVYLLPQRLCAQIADWTHEQMTIVVHCRQLPDREKLVRFICHRLWKLQLKQVQRVCIVARLMSAVDIVLWSHWVRFTPVESESTPSSNWPSFQIFKRRSPQSSSPDSEADLTTHSVFPETLLPDSEIALPSAVSLTGTPETSERSPLPSFFNWTWNAGSSRSLLWGGSAVAAFLIGCGFEAATYAYRANGASIPDPLSPFHNLPQFFTDMGDGDSSESIQSALGVVPVIPHASVNPQRATTTLLFSGSPLVSLSPLAPQDDVFHLYQEADVSMTYLDWPISSHTSDSAMSIANLATGGIDLVALNNSFADRPNWFDMGRSLREFDQAGIHTIGAGRNTRDARRPTILDVKGHRIAYLGYTYSAPTSPALESTELATLTQQLTDDIQAIRNQVDWVVVNYRWNEDLAEYPSDWQISLAHHAIDEGADLVVGHHPSVLQGAEIYRERAIAYSLGNFIFEEEASTVADYDTAVLKVSVRDEYMRVELLPVQVRESKPVILDGEAGEPVLDYLNQASALFEQPMPASIVIQARSLEERPAIAQDEPNGAMPTSDSFVSPSTESANTEPDSWVAPAVSEDTEPAPSFTTTDGDDDELKFLDSSDSKPLVDDGFIQPQ